MPAAITAIGAVSAHGVGVRVLEEALREGKSGVKPIEAFSTADLCTTLAAWAPVKTGKDRALELMNLALDEALAGRSTVPSNRRAAILGSTKGSLHRVLEGELADGIAPLAAALAKRVGARGPVVAVSAACASSSAALGEALTLLEDGTVDEVVVAGVEALHPFVFSGFHALKAMSPRNAAPFDGGRLGLSMGEGAGVLVLESGSKLKSGEKVLAGLLGFGNSADAWDQTAPHPKGEGLLRAARAALARAGLQPSDIGRYHAHGTATQQNDDMEAQVCQALFGPRGRPLTAFKGSLGHTLGAAAALDAIGTICALQRGELWPVVGHSQPQASHALDVVTQRRAYSQPTALVATAGFGGVNGALVLTRGTA